MGFLFNNKEEVLYRDLEKIVDPGTLQLKVTYDTWTCQHHLMWTARLGGHEYGQAVLSAEYGFVLDRGRVFDMLYNAVHVMLLVAASSMRG